MKKSDPPFHIVLIAPQIPPNTGNIGRTCVGTGCFLHLVGPLGFELTESKLKRAGLDYWPFLNYQTYNHIHHFFQENPMAWKRGWATSSHASKPYYSVKFNRGDYLFFGSESLGLPPEIKDPFSPNRLLWIPKKPEIRSFNLANSVSVILFEGLRQLGGLDVGPHLKL